MEVVLKSVTHAISHTILKWSKKNPKPNPAVVKLSHVQCWEQQLSSQTKGPANAVSWSSLWPKVDIQGKKNTRYPCLAALSSSHLQLRNWTRGSVHVASDSQLISAPVISPFCPWSCAVSFWSCKHWQKPISLVGFFCEICLSLVDLQHEPKEVGLCASDKHI